MELREAQRKCSEVVNQVSSYYVGDRSVVEKALASVIARGHVLFEDHPGLGKTLLAKLLAKSLGCEFTRVQFTPDMLPSDIIGFKVWRQGLGVFEVRKGPVFTNILLADEINRATPKTQAALLEAMEERQVTIDGETFKLPDPFIVLATQNPLGFEGTHPLPETQLDRFLVRLTAGYPRDLSREKLVLRRRVSWRRDDPTPSVKSVVTRTELLEIQDLAEESIYVSDGVLDYIARLVRSIRSNPKVEAGPSPRGGIALLKISRGVALIKGRDYVTPDDVKYVAVDVLAHRMIMKPEAVVEGVKPESIVLWSLNNVKVPKEAEAND